MSMQRDPEDSVEHRDRINTDAEQYSNQLDTHEDADFIDQY